MSAQASHSPEAGAASALDSALSSEGVAAADRAHDDYRVRIPSFEGPLDLLLHLIRKDQLNIYDIPIAKICKSYLDHIAMMTSPDMNLAGEFMVMASTLIYMKSLMLMPQEPGAEEENDPRLPLVAQLLEYEKFKKAAEKLDASPWLGRDIYARPPGSASDVVPVEALLTAPIDPVDTFQLLLCLKAALSRTERKPIRIESDPISIKEKVVQAGELLEQSDIIDFTKLLPEECRVSDVIVAFFAILELARLKYIEIVQHENYGPIQLRGVRPIRDLNVALLDQF